MNKNKLITFILNDISELDMLTKCMESMETIPYAMHDLALQKVRNILSEFEQLSVESKEEGQTKTVEKTVVVEQPRVEDPVKAEPVQEEVKVDTQVAQVQKVDAKEVSQEKNVTAEIDITAAQDTVKVVAKEPEAKVIEELSVPKSEPEVKVSAPVVEKKNNEQPVAEPTVARPKVVEQPKSTVSNTVTTNERFKGGRRLESRFVTDLRKALNINDRFRYQKELFGGDMSLLNKTVDVLDAMSSFDEAAEYVSENFNWDTNEGAALEFMELLEARFTN